MRRVPPGSDHGPASRKAARHPERPGGWQDRRLWRLGGRLWNHRRCRLLRHRDWHQGRGARGDFFGYSTAVSGTTVVAGAPGTTAKPGAAYIYARRTAGWPAARAVTLNNPALTTGGDFGLSVAVSGGIAVVGAPDSTSSGEAYVYAMSTAGWPTSPAAVLRHPAGDATFGYSTATYGNTAIAGEPSVAPGPGAAIYRV